MGDALIEYTNGIANRMHLVKPIDSYMNFYIP